MLLYDAPTVGKVAARLVDKLLGGGEEAEDHPASVMTGLARRCLVSRSDQSDDIFLKVLAWCEKPR